MNFYSVMRYGNDIEGSDGADTEFLVLADSVGSAAEIVDDALKGLPHLKVKPFSHAVVLIGESYSECKQPMILVGPLESKRSRLCLGVPEKNIWKRCEETGVGAWIPFDEY